jgi:hypothetical protein
VIRKFFDRLISLSDRLNYSPTFLLMEKELILTGPPGTTSSLHFCLVGSDIIEVRMPVAGRVDRIWIARGKQNFSSNPADGPVYFGPGDSLGLCTRGGGAHSYSVHLVVNGVMAGMEIPHVPGGSHVLATLVLSLKKM